MTCTSLSLEVLAAYRNLRGVVVQGSKLLYA